MTSLRDAQVQELIAQNERLLAALRALTEWGCTYTSPRDANSPHKLLIQARELITQAEEKGR